MFQCDEAVCNNPANPCDMTAGSGADGKTSAFQDCVKQERARGGTIVPRGACYDVATMQALETCFPSLSGPVTNFCIVGEEFTPTGTSGPDVTKLRFEAVEYMRGACRDNGNWTNADQPCSTPPCETGTDAGPETGSDADAAPSDAPTDTTPLPDTSVDVPVDVPVDVDLDTAVDVLPG
jgi:hypothetical protein